MALGFVCERSPPFVFADDHHAYRLHTGSLTIDEARARCLADGGRLAALETDAERLFVGKNVGIASFVDASDAADENHFVWPSGEAVDSAWFAAGQPDDVDGSQQCLMLTPSDRFTDATCSEPRAYICEFY